MQRAIKNQLQFVLTLVLALSIAMAPLATTKAYAAPASRVTIGERLKVWAGTVRGFFRHSDKDGREFITQRTMTVIEGNDEVATTGAILDQSEGPVIVLADAEEDQAIIERVKQGPNAANTQIVEVTTPEKKKWKATVKERIGNKLDTARQKIKGLKHDLAFRAYMMTIAGNGLGLGITLWMTNTTLATGSALAAIIMASGLFSNLKIGKHTPYPWLLNHGATGLFKAADGLAKLLKRSAVPYEGMWRRLGMLGAGISVTAVPTAAIFMITGSELLTAAMFFNTIKNAWDIPLDVIIQDLYERGKISLATRQKAMGIKSFGGPVLDNLATANFSVGGFPIAQVIAYALAFGGGAQVLFNERIGRAFAASATRARVIASKSKEVGVKIANSFGGVSKRVANTVPSYRAAEQKRTTLRLVQDHVTSRSCDLVLGARYRELAPTWAGRRVADDIN